MIQIKIAERLRALRIEKGLKRVVLARMLHVTPGALANWETARSRPQYEDLAILAEIFYTTTDYLIGATDERNRR